MKDNDYIGMDKLYHFSICTLIAFLHPYLAIGAALGKEYGDSKASGNHWCWWDLLADTLGIGVGTVSRYFIIGEWI